MIKAIENKDRRVQAQYLVDGVVVTLCKPGRVRKGERTWRAVRGSVANMGHQAATLTGGGMNVRRG